MKKNDLDKILDEWSTGANISNNDPFPATDSTPEDVEDLAGNDAGPSGTDTGMQTNIPGPANPENIPGPDRKKVMKEAPGDVVKTSSSTSSQTSSIPKEPPMVAPDMKMDPSQTPDPYTSSGSGGGLDPAAMQGDPSMMGMGMETPGPTDKFEVGRIYELKKIYSRLVSIQSYLSGTTDVNLIKLRNYVANTMDLFRTMISNINHYKDNLDEIIVTFYKVVDNIYVILSKYYKDKDTGRVIKAVV